MTTKYGYLRLSPKGLTHYSDYVKDLKANGATDATIVTDKVVFYSRPNFSALLERLQAGDEIIVCRKSHLSANPDISSSLIATVGQHAAFVAVIDEKLIYNPDGSTRAWKPVGDLQPSVTPPIAGGDGGGNG